MRLLLDCGAQADAEDDDGRTALHWAARSGDGTVVQMLLDHGADINEEDNNGETPMHWAADMARSGRRRKGIIMDRRRFTWHILEPKR